MAGGTRTSTVWAARRISAASPALLGVFWQISTITSPTRSPAASRSEPVFNCLTNRLGVESFVIAIMMPRLVVRLGFLAVIVRKVGEQHAPGMSDTIGMANELSRGCTEAVYTPAVVGPRELGRLEQNDLARGAQEEEE